MKLIKKLFLFILVATGMGAGVYWANNRGYFENTPLAKVSWPKVSSPSKLSSQLSNQLKIPDKVAFPNFNQKKIKEITQDATTQTQELASKAQEVGKHAQNILGATTKEGEEQPPLQERALEYGKYIYCKEVVKEYEM